MSLDEISVAQVGQPLEAPGLAKPHKPADHCVCSSLRNSLLDEEFHERCGVQKTLVNPARNPVSSETGIVDNDRSEIDAGLNGVKGIEQWFLVLLKVAVVCQGKSFDKNH